MHHRRTRRILIAAVLFRYERTCEILPSGDGSDTVKKIFQTTVAVLQESNLGILEVQSAFGMKVRTRQITSEDAAVLRQRLLGDVAGEIVRLIHLDSQHVSRAGMLVGKYGLTRRMRTPDALQLAIAMDLQKKSLLDVFVVADRLLAEVAL